MSGLAIAGRTCWLVVAISFTVGASACHRMYEHEKPEDDSGNRGRQVRLLDTEGQVLGSYRTHSRSATAYDPMGIPIARARALPSHVEVLDRAATVVLTITSADDPETGPSSGHFAELADGDGAPLGFLRVWPGERVVRSSVRRADLEETVVHIRDHSEVAEVYGAEGTDLVLRVYPVARHRLEIANLEGDIVAQFVGAPLETWIGAALGMVGPLPENEGQAYFRVGLLTYLRQL